MKKIFVLFLMLSVSMSLCACTKQKKEEKQSGSTLDTVGLAEEETDFSIYPLCNHTHFYVLKKKGVVEQHDYTGKLQQTISIPKCRHLYYVTDQELFYERETKDYRNEFWSVPIRQNKDGEEVLAAQAKRVMDTDQNDGIYNGQPVYAGERYIVYTDWKHQETHVFDRKKDRDHVINNKKTKGNSCWYLEPVFQYQAQSGVFLQADLRSMHGGIGLYYYDFASGKCQTIESDKENIGFLVKACGTKVYYQSCGETTKRGYNYCYEDIYCYDAGTGKKNRIVEGEQIKKVLKEYSLLVSGYSDLYLDGDILYLQIRRYDKGDGGGLSQAAILKIDMGNGNQITYEEKLSRWIVDNEVSVTDGYAGFVQGMYVWSDSTELEGYGKERYGFDVEKQEGRGLKPSETEYYYLEWQAEDW